MLSATINLFFKLFSVKTARLLLVISWLICFLPTAAQAKQITPRDSVEQALLHSPQLKAQEHQQQAAQFDLQQARNSYLPSIDLNLGYGVDQHSDITTRRENADPSDADWDNRSNASVTLTQDLYTGGETGHQIKIRRALLESAQLQQNSAKQTVTLDALSAHLEIVRQRELVELAERNLAVHQDIYQSLEERAQAGSGNLADVSQAQARLARARTGLYFNKSELAKAVVAYARLVGTAPEPQQMSYVETPSNLPANLALALQRMEQQNPDLIALKTTLTEAEGRIGLAQANFRPKLDLQLSSRYADQIEGDKSWQNTNEAMVNLRWNLFNGGQDRASRHAAMARKLQSRSTWEDKLFELRETTAATWETYQSLQDQKTGYRDAAKFSRMTFDAYLNQFSISQRSLLDILSAESDYFQSARQLINITVNETLTAYQLLALTGDLQNLQFSGAKDNRGDFDWLKQRPEFFTTSVTPASNEPEPVELTTEETLTHFIETWADMWAAQDVSGYLACYSDQFTPEADRSFANWRNWRQKALTNPAFIELSLGDLKLVRQDDASYLATFTQHYQSDRYSDRISKALTLKRQASTWKIYREKVITSPAGELSATPVQAFTNTADAEDNTLYVINVGPCINKNELEQAKSIFSDMDIKFDQKTGTGQVKTVRLYEGSYPLEQAREKLKEMKEDVEFSYLLAGPDKQFGLYLGSFHERERAVKFAGKLRTLNIETTLIEAEVEMTGDFLISQEIDHATGELLTNRIEKVGIPAHLNSGDFSIQ